MRERTMALGRKLLRAWAAHGRAPGWQYLWSERLASRLAGVAPCHTILPNGCTVVCNLRDHVEQHLYFQGTYEPVETYLFTRLCQPGMTVIDAGANIGVYSLLAAPLIAPGQVHSFEPVPQTCARLRANLELNPGLKVRVNQSALWSETAHLKLNATAPGNSGTFSAALGGDGAVSAPGLRLDDYIAATGVTRVDLIKMDVEGAEFRALQGMRKVLSRFHPLLLMEICPENGARFGDSMNDIWNLLVGEMGYQAWLIGHMPAACRTLTNLGKLAQSNVLFHRGELPVEVRSGWDLKSVLRWARTGWT